MHDEEYGWKDVLKMDYNGPHQRVVKPILLLCVLTRSAILWN